MFQMASKLFLECLGLNKFKLLWTGANEMAVICQLPKPDSTDITSS